MSLPAPADEALTRLSTSWTTPADFTDLARLDIVTGRAVAGDRVGGDGRGAPDAHGQRLVPTSTGHDDHHGGAGASRSRPEASGGGVGVCGRHAEDPGGPRAQAGGVSLAPGPAHASTGLASWYGARAGTCASPTLAFGTVVTVTDVSTGASVRCTVDDREAHNPGRVIDLAPTDVLPAGEARGRGDRGAPQLVSGPRPPAAAPFMV